MENNMENIEFCVYDYPYKNSKLNKYNIREIVVEHLENSIQITFTKKDIIPAVGIIITKFNELGVEKKINTSLYV
jgi:hypothetical protein